MFGLNLPIKAIVALVVIAALAVSHITVYRMGKSNVMERLRADNITVLRDGREIDEEIESLDDDGLCAILGGCDGVPDDAGSN